MKGSAFEQCFYFYTAILRTVYCHPCSKTFFSFWAIQAISVASERLTFPKQKNTVVAAQTTPLLIIAIETKPCKPLRVHICRHRHVRVLLKGKDPLSSHMKNWQFWDFCEKYPKKQWKRTCWGEKSWRNHVHISEIKWNFIELCKPFRVNTIFDSIA